MGKCLFMRKGETHTAPISGILASDLAVGSSVYLMENGVATEYLVVNQGKPSGSSLYDDSCDGTWLLRKDCHSTRQWHSSDVNDYKNSDIHAWLNGDFFNLFGYVEQNSINQVKIPYVDGTGGSSVSSGANGLPAKIFLLSSYEVGFTQSDVYYLPIDGSKLEYFESGLTSTANEKRIGKLNGEGKGWWTRSPNNNIRTSSIDVGYNGSYSNDVCTYSNSCCRPALILPSTAVFDETTMLLKGVA